MFYSNIHLNIYTANGIFCNKTNLGKKKKKTSRVHRKKQKCDNCNTDVVCVCVWVCLWGGQGWVYVSDCLQQFVFSCDSGLKLIKFSSEEELKRAHDTISKIWPSFDVSTFSLTSARQQQSQTVWWKSCVELMRHRHTTSSLHHSSCRVFYCSDLNVIFDTHFWKLERKRGLKI